MSVPRKSRIVSLDVIRIFACLCVTIVHFNAAISAYNGGFVYPNSIIPNFYVDGTVYLGSIGVSLFFMISGASLKLTYRKGNLLRFYKRRILSIYPMFWLAFILATIIDFMRIKWMSSGNLSLILFSFLGIDGNLCALGIIPYDFYKVGEWFLGCLIALYAIYPLIDTAVDKCPLLSLLGSVVIYVVGEKAVPLIGIPVAEHLFLMRIPELIVGMLFIKYDVERKPKVMLSIAATVFVLATVFRPWISSLTYCIAFCMVLFAALVLIAKLIKNDTVKYGISFGAKMTYPIFLVHHWLIDRMVQGFYLAEMPRRYVFMMFGVYMVVTIILSYWLMIFTERLITRVKNRIIA